MELFPTRVYTLLDQSSTLVPWSSMEASVRSRTRNQCTLVPAVKQFNNDEDVAVKRNAAVHSDVSIIVVPDPGFREFFSTAEDIAGKWATNLERPLKPNMVG